MTTRDYAFRHGTSEVRHMGQPLQLSSGDDSIEMAACASTVRACCCSTESLSARVFVGQLACTWLAAACAAFLVLLAATQAWGGVGVSLPASAPAPRPPVRATEGVPPARLQLSESTLILSVERVASVSHWMVTSEWDDARGHTRTELGATNVNLLWATCASANCAVNPYVTPRLSADVLVRPHVTVGGSVGYLSMAGGTDATTGTSAEHGSSTTAYKLPTTQSFVFAARAGYAFSLPDALGVRLGVWLRAGLEGNVTRQLSETISVASNGAMQRTPTIHNSNGFALSIDPLLTMLPVPRLGNAGIATGPVVDIALGGTSKQKTTSTRISQRFSSYGWSFTVFVYF